MTLSDREEVALRLLPSMTSGSLKTLIADRIGVYDYCLRQADDFLAASRGDGWEEWTEEECAEIKRRADRLGELLDEPRWLKASEVTEPGWYWRVGPGWARGEAVTVTRNSKGEVRVWHAVRTGPSDPEGLFLPLTPPQLPEDSP